MNTILALTPFLPVVIYLAFACIAVKTLKRFDFNLHAIILSLAVVLHVVIAVFVIQQWYLALLSIILGAILYLLFVYFLGGKTSGETLFVISATLMLTPLPNGIVGFGLGMLILVAAVAFSLRKNFTEFTSIVSSHTSVASGIMPDYSGLPNRKSESIEVRKVHVAPFFLVGSIIGGLITALFL